MKVFNKIFLFSIILSVYFITGVFCAVQAATINWTGAIDGDLDKAGNYDPAVIPVDGDSLIIDLAFLSGNAVIPDSGTCEADVTDNYADLSPNGGTYNGSYNSTAIGGKISAGVFNGAVTSSFRIYGGTFNANVEFNGQEIRDGIFNGSFNLNSGYIAGGVFYGFVTNSGQINAGSFCQTQEEIGGEITGGTFNLGATDPLCYNYVPPSNTSVSIINPEDLSRISTWAPEFSFIDAITCGYKFDTEEFTVIDCNATSTISAPTAEWPHYLTLTADGVATSSVSFIYSAIRDVLTGSLTPNSSPAATKHTLTDIYNLIDGTSVAPVEEGNHDFSPMSSPSKSMYTVSDIYVALANLIEADKVRSGVVYLGVTGGGSTPDPVASTTLTFDPNTEPGTAIGYTLADIYNLINNETDGTSRITSPSHVGFTPATGPTETTLNSIEDIYRTLTTLIQPGNILQGTTYLGVAGTYITP